MTKPNIEYRTMDVELELIQPTDEQRAQDPAAEVRVSLALSSEHPVERMDWMEGKRFKEVLDHSPDSVDLSYARDGMPLLLGHSQDSQIGILENVRVGADKKIRGEARFSKSQPGQDTRQDVVDGIRKKVSVGYRIDKSKIEITRGDPDKKELDIYRIKRWTPMEASIVAIPADYSVGVGRSAGDGLPDEVNEAIEVVRRHLSLIPPTAPKANKEHKLSDTVTVTERDEAVKAERKRGSDIRALASQYKSIPAETVETWIAEGRSVEGVGATILGILRETGAAGAPSGKPAVELNDSERKQYSFQRAILNHALRAEGRKIGATFEDEIATDLEKAAKEAGVARSGKGGFLVPTFTSTEAAREIMARQNFGEFHTRAGLDSITATKGQELKFTVPGEFLEILRNYMVAFQAGTTLYAGLQGPVAFPQQNGAGTATWVGENPGSDVADSNLTLTQVALNPKSVMSSTSFSRQLLAQSVIDVDGTVKNDLAQIVALALDLAVINGAGGNAPTGILGTAGIGSVALGTNGATPTYNNLVDLETAVTTANADQWPLAHLIHPTSRGTFKKATVLSNTAGKPVWSDAEKSALNSTVSGGGSRRKGELNGYDAYASNQVPNNLTKGSSVGICLAILLGAFSQAVVGDWGMMELIVDPYRLKKQGMIEVTAFAMYGFAVKYPAAFASIKDALA